MNKVQDQSFPGKQGSRSKFSRKTRFKIKVFQENKIKVKIYQVNKVQGLRKSGKSGLGVKYFQVEHRSIISRPEVNDRIW